MSAAFSNRRLARYRPYRAGLQDTSRVYESRQALPEYGTDPVNAAGAAPVALLHARHGITPAAYQWLAPGRSSCGRFDAVKLLPIFRSRKSGYAVEPNRAVVCHVPVTCRPACKSNLVRPLGGPDGLSRSLRGVGRLYKEGTHGRASAQA